MAPLRRTCNSGLFETSVETAGSSVEGSYRYEEGGGEGERTSAESREDTSQPRPRETKSGSLMEIHQARQTQELRADSRRSQVHRRPSTVSIRDKGRFKMLTFQVRWKRGSF